LIQTGATFLDDLMFSELYRKGLNSPVVVEDLGKNTRVSANKL